MQDRALERRTRHYPPSRKEQRRTKRADWPARSRSRDGGRLAARAHVLVYALLGTAARRRADRRETRCRQCGSDSGLARSTYSRCPACGEETSSGAPPIIRYVFSFERKSRIASLFAPLKLGDVGERTWSSDWTTELLDLLNALALLVELEPDQETLLQRLLESTPISGIELKEAGLLPASATLKPEKPQSAANLFEAS